MQTFSINQAIDTMDDFGWCPITECGNPAEVDKLKNFGQCTECQFKFCLLCKERYHKYKKCRNTIEEEIELLKGKIKVEEELHEKRTIAMLSNLYIQNCTKQCPSCNYPI